MKTTRMRMTKSAAEIIHNYRDGHGHKTNSNAVYGLISDLDVANCNEVFMSKQLSDLQHKNERLQRANNCLNSNLLMAQPNREDDLEINLGTIRGLEDGIKLRNSQIDDLQATIFNNGKWMVAAKGKMLVLGLLAFIGWGGFIAMLV